VPGSPEFIRSYEEAHAQRVKPKTGVLQSLITAYQLSTDFTGLAPRTQSDYKKAIGVIEKRFGTFPLNALNVKGSRTIFKDWRDELAHRSKRQADMTFTVLTRILSWGVDSERITANPCLRCGRLYKGSRKDRIWSEEDEAKFLAAAPERMRLAFLLGLETGQRQGDLLKLPWTAYNGTHLVLCQNKTAKPIKVRVSATLKAALDAAPKRAPTILTNLNGEAWTAAGFSSVWRKASRAAGITPGLAFTDLRGSCVTRLAKAGSTVPEIAAVSGHSLRGVQEILTRHYLSLDSDLADAAISKLERKRDGNLPPSYRHRLKVVK